MKWRFWQKAYFATLLLFLAALFGGVFGMAYVSWQQSFGAETDKAIDRQQLLAGVLGSAVAEVDSGHEWTIPALFEAYGRDAVASGGAIELTQGDSVLYSNLPVFQKERAELSVKQGEIQWIVREISGRNYLYVSSRLPEQTLVLTRIQDITELVKDWQQMIILYVIAFTSISGVFAVSLFFILRRLSRPLEKLTLSAKSIAAGAYDTRVPVKGQDEVAELSVSFNEMAGAVQKNTSELEKAALQKQRLIDNLSHEIRTPTTAIQGYAEYAQRAAITPERAHDIMGRIQGETARLKRIAERMLALSAMEHDVQTFRPVLLENIFSQSQRSLEWLAENREVRLAFRLHDTRLAVLGDETLLESLIVNLVENAIKACSKEGTVFVTAEENLGSIEVNVIDDGQGMSSEQLSHLGETFYRADKSRSRKDGGAGLGVPLCFEIIRLHSGTLVYTSEEGKGTAATVCLPC